MHPVLYFPIRFQCFWTTSIISKRDFVPDQNQASLFSFLIIIGGRGGFRAVFIYLSFCIFISFYRYTVWQSVRYNSFSQRFLSFYLRFMFLLSGFHFFPNLSNEFYDLCQTLFLLDFYRKEFWKNVSLSFWNLILNSFEVSMNALKIFIETEKKNWLFSLWFFGRIVSLYKYAFWKYFSLFDEKKQQNNKI